MLSGINHFIVHVYKYGLTFSVLRLEWELRIFSTRWKLRTMCHHSSLLSLGSRTDVLQRGLAHSGPGTVLSVWLCCLMLNAPSNVKRWLCYGWGNWSITPFTESIKQENARSMSRPSSVYSKPLDFPHPIFFEEFPYSRGNWNGSI
jgi:hypothetical protein